MQKIPVNRYVPHYLKLSMLIQLLNLCKQHHAFSVMYN